MFYSKAGKIGGIIFISCFAIGFLSGFYLRFSDGPYELYAKELNINIPVSKTSSLKDNKYALGEKYLAEDMAYVFEKMGYKAHIQAIEDTYAHRNSKAMYEIYMRPYPELAFASYHNVFDKDKVAVLFETIPYKSDEVRRADVIFTGSLKKNKEYRKLGLESYFLPQFTRLDKFYYAPKEEMRTTLLFIGNRWSEEESRYSVEYALEFGFDIAVYGSGWKDVLTGENASLYKGYQIVNDDLKYYYSSADIVLNDTREDMKEAGFVSNRIFDVTACGGFIISDYIAEIEEIYGDSIPMYKNKKEFKALVEYYLAHPDERRRKAEQAQKITRERFGAEVILKEMIDVLEKYRYWHKRWW